MPDLAITLKLLGEAWKIIGYHLKNGDLEDANRALDAIQRIWETVEGAKGNHITPEDAFAELERLRSDILANDAAADTAVSKRFESD